MPDPLSIPPVDPVSSAIRNRMAADPAYVSRLFQIESSGNPNAVTGSNRGLGQFGPQEESRYGLNDANRGDYGAQSSAVGREYSEHYPILQKRLGRDPTPGEMYLMHQQGIAGGPALMTAEPTTPAWQAIRPYYKNDAIARQAITGNIPQGHDLYGRDPDQVTAGDFTKLWTGKFGGAAAPAVAGAPAAPAAAPVIAQAPAQTAPVGPAGDSSGESGEAVPSPSVQGMIDPNEKAWGMFQKFGGGRGILNGQQAEAQAPQMMRLRNAGGTPMAQQMRQSLLANILRKQ